MKQNNTPINGTVSEVGGILSPMTMRKTVIERRVVMPSVTFSPESEGI